VELQLVADVDNSIRKASTREFQMPRSIKTRKEIAAMIVERVNAEAPEKIEEIDILPLVSNSFNANWTPGAHKPSTIRGGVTENILQRVVADLRRQFDISA
jgi:hypothetical protein